MYKIKGKLTIIVTLMILLFSTNMVYATENNTVQNNNAMQSNQLQNNQKQNVTNEDLIQESSSSKLEGMKREQLKTIDDYKAWYGSDTYGMVAYVLILVQKYSIPLGLVGIAIAAIYEYVIGIKRLDIRDRGFNSMIAVVTLIIICQVLPLIFTVVVKSMD